VLIDTLYCIFVESHILLQVIWRFWFLLVLQWSLSLVWSLPRVWMCILTMNTWWAHTANSSNRVANMATIVHFRIIFVFCNCSNIKWYSIMKSAVIWYPPVLCVCVCIYIYIPITVTKNSCIRQLIVGDFKSIVTNSDVIQSCITMFVSAHPLVSVIHSTLHTKFLQYVFNTKPVLSSKLWCPCDLFPWAISYKILIFFSSPPLFLTRVS